uniref:Uncharacterized protein n=1 Tax=Setaria viridis TaxID=4556 RepID=A0A4U6WBV9_SETVI|nr:hypothetical protein SEVIR_1G115650v2 [Setaria viridis]
MHHHHHLSLCLLGLGVGSCIVVSVRTCPCMSYNAYKRTNLPSNIFSFI